MIVAAISAPICVTGRQWDVVSTLLVEGERVAAATVVTRSLYNSSTDDGVYNAAPIHHSAHHVRLLRHQAHISDHAARSPSLHQSHYIISRTAGTYPVLRPALLHGHQAVGLLDRVDDGLPVQRTQRAEVDHLRDIDSNG
jgi:hypothetical protein